MAKWEKGQSGNPAGRTPGSKNKVSCDLREAIKEIEKKHKYTLFEQFVARAYRSDKVLIALIKKLVPDKTELKGLLDGEVTFKLTGVDISKYPKKKPDKEKKTE